MTKCLIAACLLLAGCAAAPGGKEATFLCEGGRQGVASFAGDNARLAFANETFELQRVPSASGARYNGVRASLFTKDDEALIEIDGRQLGPCQEVKPRR